MRTLFVLGVGCLTLACGAAPYPGPAPSPIAVIVNDVAPTITCTGTTCTVTGVLLNTGPACASHVRGNTHIVQYARGPFIIGVDWFGPALMRPNERVPYTVTGVDVSGVTIGPIETSFGATPVVCP